MRTRTQVLLILEFVLGVVPAIAFYAYHFPVGVFWVRKVLELAIGGTTNLYTTSIALILVAGGLGLVSLCCSMLARLSGHAFPGRVLLTGLLIGSAASIAYLILISLTDGFWMDYYIFGSPLLVGAHQLSSGMRHKVHRLNAPAQAVP